MRAGLLWGACLSAAALLCGAGAAEDTPPDRPGNLFEPLVREAPRPRAITPKLTPAQKKTAAALKRRAKPAAKPSRKGGWNPIPPQNAAEVGGLYTVEKQGSGVWYRKGYVLGVGINVIEADLSDPEVRVGAMVARGGIGTAERFGQMVGRTRPAAAITGTFFGVRSHIPTGDLVINGQQVFRGFVGTAVAITEGNVVSFIPTRPRDPHVDWSLYDTVIRGGPRLVADGRCVVQARREGFRTLSVSTRRTRTAVALTRDNHLQFVAVRQGITLYELAKRWRAAS
jgi:hypothetical protein